MHKMTQPEFVDLVERASLSRVEALCLRLMIGIDGAPMKMAHAAKRIGVSKQALHQAIPRIRAKLARLPFLPIDKVESPKHTKRTEPPAVRLKGYMTISRAEKIIGGTVAVGKFEGGYVRAACHHPDGSGEVLSETSKNIPDALRLLIQTHYAEARKVVLKRDNYRCTNCGAFRNLECDHKTPRARGERCDHPSNLITLCQGCHKIRHSRKGFHAAKGISPTS